MVGQASVVAASSVDLGSDALCGVGICGLVGRLDHDARGHEVGRRPRSRTRPRSRRRPRCRPASSSVGTMRCGSSRACSVTSCSSKATIWVSSSMTTVTASPLPSEKLRLASLALSAMPCSTRLVVMPSAVWMRGLPALEVSLEATHTAHAAYAGHHLRPALALGSDAGLAASRPCPGHGRRADRPQRRPRCRR